MLDATVNLFPSGPHRSTTWCPPTGVAAQFGTNLLLIDAFITIHVRTGGDYGLTAGLTNTSTLLPLFGSTLTLWGVPGDPGHDNVRTCPGGTTPCPAGGGDKPLLTMPTQCGPLQYSIAADSWQGDSASTTFTDPNPITGLSNAVVQSVDQRRSRPVERRFAQRAYRLTSTCPKRPTTLDRWRRHR